MKIETGPVTIREVGLRDGLQSITRVLPTARKIEWIRDACAAGQREIEVGSFVPARLLPLPETPTCAVGCNPLLRLPVYR